MDRRVDYERVREFSKSLNSLIRQVGKAPDVRTAHQMVDQLDALAGNLRRNLDRVAAAERNHTIADTPDR